LDLALLFPGQGSQSVGMGKDLAARYPEARAVFEEADDVLGADLSRLAWDFARSFTVKSSKQATKGRVLLSMRWTGE